MGLFKKKKKEETLNFIDYIIDLKYRQLAIREKNIFHAIDILATTLSLAEFEVYEPSSSLPVKNEIYYTLNLKPNKNELAFSFWYNFWKKVIKDGKCLIVEINNKLYIADDYQSSNSIIKEKYYQNVVISDLDGNSCQINKTFFSNDALEIKYLDKNITDYLSEFYKEYSDLITISKEFYRSSNVKKWKLGISGNQPAIIDAKTKKEISYEEYKNKLVGSLFSNESCAILLSKETDLVCLNAEQKTTSDDFFNILEGWDKETAKIFNIPLNIFIGDSSVTASDFDNYISRACLHYFKLIEDGLNSKLFTRDEYLKNNKIHMNKDRIRYHDLIDSAPEIDKLYADGFSHDDILKILGREPLNEKWSQEHRITKNYSEDVSKKGEKGGDKNE